MLNRYVVYFFVFELMEIIAFTIATMTKDVIFCDEGDAEVSEENNSLFGKKIYLYASFFTSEFNAYIL